MVELLLIIVPLIWLAATALVVAVCRVSAAADAQRVALTAGELA